MSFPSKDVKVYGMRESLVDGWVAPIEEACRNFNWDGTKWTYLEDWIANSPKWMMTYQRLTGMGVEPDRIVEIITTMRGVCAPKKPEPYDRKIHTTRGRERMPWE